jgi:two-component system chemotaxis response regulator CheB
MEDSLRVLVVDDTVTYRKIVSTVLAAIPGVEVVGSAPNGRIAMQKIEHLQPDLMTLDLAMPEMDGLEVLRRVEAASIDVGAVVLTSTSQRDAAAATTALTLGAFDFVVKPTGDSFDDSAAKLREALEPRLRAFARRRGVHRILRRKPPVGGPLPTTPRSPPGPPVPRGRDVPGPPTAPGAARARGPMPPAGRPSGAGKTNLVVLGISTGGPQALTRMLPRLPADLPAPLLIVQHMPAMFTRSLAEDLDRRCQLNVCEAEHGQRVRPGSVFIAPGGCQMKVERSEGGLQVVLADDPPEQSCRPSVDYLFRSVAGICGATTLGVIMTGMGYDGSEGCRLLKRAGGVILVQDEATCVVYGMPRQPAEEGIADLVVPLDAIADKITHVVKRGMVGCK